MPVTRTYQASSWIHASAERVWSVLSDVATWPEWDSGVTTVDGALVVGGKVTITVASTPRRPFPLTVAELTAPARIVLRGGMPLGLFTGRRTYSVAAEGTGARFTMREEFTGPLAGIIFRTIPDLRPGFEQFAAGLKQRAEQS